ncbi:MAG: hypothetical protein HY423_11825 [Candidatus Lambdaproteobacteria bacterium]|nr:hypothetical protein [Candidatus Lambdaproteobacteria bacterium]
MKAHFAHVAFVMVCGAVLGTCASLPQVPARGELLNQEIATTVDSRLAKYYLERTPSAAREIDPAHEARIARVHRESDGLPLDWSLLKKVSEATSPDFATLYFIRRVQADPVNARIQDAFSRTLHRVRAAPQYPACADPGALRPLFRGYRFLFVGGFHYRSDPSTGADFATPRAFLRQKGAEVELVDIDEDGIVEENAAIIAARIRREPPGTSLILVSTSKGGPEVAYALGALLSGSESRSVRAWVSIGGMLRGTQIADDAAMWPKRWIAKLVLRWLGIDPKSLDSMTTAQRRRRFDRLAIPGHVLLVQYVGVPLSGQVSPAVRERYMRLRAFGPNDGVTLLADELMAGGRTILQIGYDHFFRDAENHLKALALAHLVRAELGSALGVAAGTCL